MNWGLDIWGPGLLGLREERANKIPHSWSERKGHWEAKIGEGGSRGLDSWV